MNVNPSTLAAFKGKLRLWRTLFIHRWHAPQTIGEQYGNPNVGLRFEHVNHAESLTEYIWRYGAFKENRDGTGREDLSDKPSRANGLQAIIAELGTDNPDFLSKRFGFLSKQHLVYVIYLYWVFSLMGFVVLPISGYFMWISLP